MPRQFVIVRELKAWSGNSSKLYWGGPGGGTQWFKDPAKALRYTEAEAAAEAEVLGAGFIGEIFAYAIG